MDALDVRILRTLGVFPYGSKPQGPNALKPGHVARVLDITPETVRERIQRMEASGLIAGYEIFVNLRHLGLDASGFLFRVPDEDRRAALAKDFALVDGILEAHMFIGSEVCVDLAFPGPGALARRLEFLGRLCGDANPSRFFGWHYPPVERELTLLDWRIIKALRGRARTPLADVAKEIGVGYRTVKRRYDQMADEGSIYSIASINPAAAGGAIPFWLFFFLGPDADRTTTQRIATTFDDRRVYSDVPESPEFGNVGVFAFADTPAEVEKLRQTGAAIPGVARCRTLVPYDSLSMGAWVDEAIEARARKASAPEAETA